MVRLAGKGVTDGYTVGVLRRPDQRYRLQTPRARGSGRIEGSNAQAGIGPPRQQAFSAPHIKPRLSKTERALGGCCDDDAIERRLARLHVEARQTSASARHQTTTERTTAIVRLRWYER